jgi:SAM-dependent methyltransferase
MKEFKDSIDKQFRFNKNKNLFYDGILKSLRFSPDTLEALERVDLIDTGSTDLLADYLADRAIQEFCRVNQYYTFDKHARSGLRSIYADLFANIKSRGLSMDKVAENHYDKLIRWLQETNPFAEKIYNSRGEKIDPIVCSEYSPELQIEILQIDVDRMMEPVLDIGCGEKGNLVLYLRRKGIEAFGFDRLAFSDPYLYSSDWLEYEFEKERWGTITSNLAFSNHFQHHHFRNDGSYINYARKFMEILNSLKPGGCFHYAPDLPFIEQFLDKDKFQMTKHSIGDYDVKSTVIKRL